VSEYLSSLKHTHVAHAKSVAKCSKNIDSLYTHEIIKYAQHS